MSCYWHINDHFVWSVNPLLFQRPFGAIEVASSGPLCIICMCKHIYIHSGYGWPSHMHTHTQRACPKLYLRGVFTLTCTATPSNGLTLRLDVPAGFRGVKWGAQSLLLVGVQREEGGNVSLWPTPGITLLTLGCLDPYEPRNCRAKGGHKGVRGRGWKRRRGARGVWTSLRSLWRQKRCPCIGGMAMTLPLLWPPLTLPPPTPHPVYTPNPTPSDCSCWIPLDCHRLPWQREEEKERWKERREWRDRRGTARWAYGKGQLLVRGFYWDCKREGVGECVKDHRLRF